VSWQKTKIQNVGAGNSNISNLSVQSADTHISGLCSVAASRSILVFFFPRHDRDPGIFDGFYHCGIMPIVTILRDQLLSADKKLKG